MKHRRKTPPSSRLLLPLVFLLLLHPHLTQSHNLGIYKFSDKAILHELYDETNGDSWTRNDHWRHPETSICDWEGVDCVLNPPSSPDDGNATEFVESLVLSKNNLEGEVPLTLLLQLEHLKILKLDGNPAATFPPDLEEDELKEGNENGITSGLEIIDLSRTKLESLSALYGQGDSNLSASFPKLTNFHASECGLTGPFPPQLLRSTLLQRIVMDGNDLAGPIPAGLGNLVQLRYVNLNGNDLSSSIPASLGELAQLKYLFLRDMELTGELPEALNRLEMLEVLDVSRQRNDGMGKKGLEGWLLAFEGWERMRRLDLSYNSLTGEIPVDFLKNVDKNRFEYVMLGSNKISGELPYGPFKDFPPDAVFFEDNLIDSIDERLCAKSRGGVVALFGCDGILCPPETYHRLGRQETEEDGCLTCPKAEYYGSTRCVFGDVTMAPTKAPVPLPPVELTPREILQNLYDKTGGEGWTDNDKWNTTFHVCEWFGVQCSDDDDDDTIENIFLSGNNLVGSLPSSIFHLKQLRKLSLSKNTIRLDFADIAQASSLVSLDLSSTNLYSLDGISGASRLEDLRLEMNELTGTIPEELFELTNLEQLRLDYNSFTGPLPKEIAQLTALKTLSMDENTLSGSLPSSLSHLTSLSSLRLKSNGLSGPLPPFLKEMTTLTFLDLSHQTKHAGGFRGPLVDFANHNNLRRLDLSDNKIDGTIPLTFLSGVDPNTFEFANLSTNRLVGTVPASVAGLHDIYMQDNLLTAIDPLVCDEKHGGPIAQFRCDAVLCRMGSFNSLGRQQSYDTECRDCDTAVYLGSTSCPEEGEVPTPSPTLDEDGDSGDSGDDEMGEREILERFFADCGGNEWTEKDRWMGEDNHCQWDGIRCDDNGNVIEIILRSNNLNGDVPRQIFNLEHLETLNLDGNSISISFDGVENAKMLSNIDFSHTDLVSLKNLEMATSLTDLYLTSNRLQGTFPTEILKLSKLNRLSLALNHFSGSLPEEIGNLGELEFLSLHGNEFTGTLPPSIGSLDALLFLFLQSNFFTGSIPPEYMQLTSLWFLDMSSQNADGHKGLSGPLPSFLPLKELRRVALNDNAFSGTIPDDMLSQVDLDDFEFVDLSHNQITGMVPIILKRLPLDGLYLSDNNITSIETGFCDSDSDSNDQIATHGCDVVLCHPGSFNSAGRRDSDDNLCQTCPDVGQLYFGATECPSQAEPAPPTAPPVTAPPASVSEKDVLEMLYRTCGGERWHRKDGWMDPTQSHCQWFGIRCMEIGDGLAVASLMLSSNNLIGTPPVELYQLRHLETIVLDNNMILFDFTNIEYATSLETLDLSNTGIVSLKGLEKAKTLVELRLDGNSLGGNIPPEIFQLLTLEELSIDDNEFRGTLPADIGNLNKLRLLSAIGNELEGMLPSELEHLTNLVTLHLQQNSFTNIQNVDFDQLKGVSFLDLSHNLISGFLPSLKELQDIRRLDLSFNRFSGTVPDSFLESVHPEFLEHVDLSSNKLEGEVPQQLARLGLVDLMDNRFTSIHPDVCAVSQFGCDGVLCPKFTCNCLGRKESVKTPCEVCTDFEFYGSSECRGGSQPAPAPVGFPSRPPNEPTEVQPTNSVSEREILEEFYDQCGGYYWVSSSFWTTNESICRWDGIKCVKNAQGEEIETVEEISLGSNRVTGTPPESLYQLPNLKKISLYDNPLKSFDFTNIHKATSLEVLLLDNSGIESIDGIKGARNLVKLNLRFNRLSSFPNDIFELPRLKYLSLANNKITGVLPTKLDDMNQLQTLLLGSNRFMGQLSNKAIPPNIQILDMSKNALDGTIPTDFLQHLSTDTRLEMDISQNLLTGTVPAGLSRLVRLNVYLQDNFFSAMDQALCEKGLWNDGHVGRFGCKGLLCPKGHVAKEGRELPGDGCRVCQSAMYLGGTHCEGESVGGVVGGRLGLRALSVVLIGIFLNCIF